MRVLITVLKISCMHIALIESGLPNFIHDAGSTAIIELCELLQRMGHQLSYIYTGDNPWGRESDLKERNITILKAGENKEEFLQKYKFSSAIISRPGPAMQWLNICKQVSLPIIYFGHDIHYLRFIRGNEHIENEAEKVSEKHIRAMMLLEKSIWQKANVTLYPAEEESKIVNDFCAKDKSITIPIYDLEKARRIFEEQQYIPKKDHVYKDLLFVGGCEHKPNYYGISWFVTKVLPKIKSKVRLNIIGKWPVQIVKEITAKRQVHFLGNVSDLELLNSYKQADLVIAPLLYGAGIKRKVVEALAYSLPVLSTEIGFAGITISKSLKEKLCVNPDAGEFARKLDILLNNEDAKLKEDLANSAKQIISLYSDEYRKKQLEKAFSYL